MIRLSILDQAKAIAELCMGNPTLGMEVDAELQSLHSPLLGLEPRAPSMA
jgi:hypothetical protein